jgi:hypothetical protein
MDVNGDCGLRAHKIGSLIAEKLESLRARKPGHSKRITDIYIFRMSLGSDLVRY